MQHRVDRFEIAATPAIDHPKQLEHGLPMRLICPNCDAQYEVDAALIPASGRDVQCSNCGKTWFQGPDEPVSMRAPEPAAETDTEAEKSGDGLDDEAAAFFGKEAASQDEAPVASRDTYEFDEIQDDEPSADPEAPDVPRHEEPAVAQEDASNETPDMRDAPSGEDTDPDTDEELDEDAGPPVGRERPPIDPKVLGILRAEAEREIAARRAEEAAGIEMQGDLGLNDPDPVRGPRSETEIRTARLRGLDEDGDARHARNAILPNIDDINASLTATSDRGLPDTPAEVAEKVHKRRSGFRAGFSAMMLAVAAVILVYLFAPQIAATVPALEPALSAYVDWANGMRIAIDSAMDRTAQTLSGG